MFDFKTNSCIKYSIILLGNTDNYIILGRETETLTPGLFSPAGKKSVPPP